MKERFIKLNLILFVITSFIFLFDLFIFITEDESIKGYLLERYLYLYSIILCIYFLKTKKLNFNNKIKIYLKVCFVLLLISPILYIGKSGKLGSSDEIKLNNKLKIRESISVESMPAFSIYENSSILENEKSRWHNRILIGDNEYRSLSEIDSAKIISFSEKKYIIEFYKNNKIGKAEFEIKNIR